MTNEINLGKMYQRERVSRASRFIPRSAEFGSSSPVIANKRFTLKRELFIIKEKGVHESFQLKYYVKT